jgi:hypothetical protein
MNTPLDKNIPIMDKIIPVDEIKALLTGLSNDLNEALESGDLEKTLAAQKTFTAAIDMLWKTAQEIGVDPKTKAIFRLIVGWALEELPKQISDPANHAEIKRQLKIFQKSMAMFN